jgi:hypothetical protein
MNTDPFWDTDTFDFESILLPVAGALLFFGSAMRAIAAARGNANTKQAQEVDDKIVSPCFILGFGALAISAFIAFEDTFDHLTLDNHSTAMIRGARAVDGIVGLASLMLMLANTPSIREWVRSTFFPSSTSISRKAPVKAEFEPSI